MPIMNCGGGCDRSISISAVPGGNPAAKADPESYASEWSACSCKSFTCDRCIAKQQGRCKCGQTARLFTEPERIQVAMNMAKGLPAIPAAAAAAPPAAPAVAGPMSQGHATPSVSVCVLLDGMGQQIDGDLARNQVDRARAVAGLTGTIMTTQGQNAQASELGWLLHFGESYYRWRFFAEGAQYWKGLYQLLRKLGQGDTENGARAVASSGAFQILSGELTASAPHAQNTAAFVAKIFGAGHVLSRDVYAKLGTGGPPSAPPASLGQPPPVNMAPVAAPKSSIAALDTSTKLALWVTLGFFEVAVADGAIADSEYLAWKQSMERMKLPDVWDRFGGAQGLKDLGAKGALQEISIEFASLPQEMRVKMTGILLEFMMADGKVEPREVAAIQRISGWIGVPVKLG